MSKSKSKGSKESTKSQSDVLTKVKDAAVVKPAQTVKSKAKDLAKAVAGKEEKKSKQKKVKEPTPEPSDSESEESESESPDSDSSADSDSDSESEVEVKPVSNGKTNGAKKVAAAADSSDESDSSESSADEAPVEKTNGAKLPAAKLPAAKLQAAKAESESDEASDSDDSEDDSEEEKPKAVTAKANKVKAPASSDEESDADSDDSEEDSDDSDDSEDSEKEVKPKAAANKRKAEEETVPAAKKAKTETNGAVPESGNLFVGNLSWNVDEDWLTREFETFGELQGVRIITDRESGRSKGFGYVEFVNPADAGKAHTAKAGSELDGRNINVDFAVKREQGAKPADRANDRRKSYGDSTSEPSDTLFCGNLSFDADQDTISQAFGEYGTVLGVRLPTDRETGAPKGFGYVTFSSVEEAGAAMESMNGAEIAGRSVRLDYSQPRPQNGDSPARGRGGFGGGRGGGRGFGDRGGRGGGRGFGGGRGGGRGFGDRGGRSGGRGASTNRGGFGDFSGKKTTF